MPGTVSYQSPSFLSVFRSTRLTLPLSSYYWITRAFQSPSGSVSQLVNGLDMLGNSGTRRSGNGEYRPGFGALSGLETKLTDRLPTALDTSVYGSFLENHDVERFPYLTRDMSLVKNVSLPLKWRLLNLGRAGSRLKFMDGGCPL